MDELRAKASRPWALESRDHLRIGQTVVSLADVETFEAGDISEPNVMGHLTAVSLFLFGGALFILPVALQVARPKFLLGGGLLVAIGLTAFCEIVRLRSVHLFRVDIRMKGGRVIRFTSDQKAETEALAGLLGMQRR